MEMHTAKRDEELINQTPTKLSKKEKKKQKEAKKLLKNKKLDADKVRKIYLSHCCNLLMKFIAGHRRYRTQT